MTHRYIIALVSLFGITTGIPIASADEPSQESLVNEAGCQEGVVDEPELRWVDADGNEPQLAIDQPIGGLWWINIKWIVNDHRTTWSIGPWVHDDGETLLIDVSLPTEVVSELSADAPVASIIASVGYFEEDSNDDRQMGSAKVRWFVHGQGLVPLGVDIADIHLEIQPEAGEQQLSPDALLLPFSSEPTASQVVAIHEILPPDYQDFLESEESP